MIQKSGRSYLIDRYNDGTLKVTEVYNIDLTHCEKKEKDVAKGSGQSENRLRSSLCRSKNKIYDIAHSMNCEYFGTLTFSPEYHIDRTNIADCKAYLSRWFNNLRKKHPDIQYLAVPEYHTLKAGQKKKGVHFHILVGNFPEDLLVDSGRNMINGKAYKRTEKNKDDGQFIYNLNSWAAGFTNFTKVKDPQRVANYILKYITKTLFEDDHLKNKQRYLVSENIPTPERLYAGFVDGLNSMFDTEAYNAETGEFFPTALELSENFGNYEFSGSSPCDITTDNFEYHATKYFFKKKEIKNDSYN